MSYCRWSSDNFDCDIYAYESCYGGFQVHIATNRYVGEIPKVNYNLIQNDKTHQQFIEQRKAQSKFLENNVSKPIGLPHDGETFLYESLEDFKQAMIGFRKLGYRFPNYVIESIQEEINSL